MVQIFTWDEIILTLSLTVRIGSQAQVGGHGDCSHPWYHLLANGISTTSSTDCINL